MIIKLLKNSTLTGVFLFILSSSALAVKPDPSEESSKNSSTHSEEEQKLDPVKVLIRDLLTTEEGIFSKLSPAEQARCRLVSKDWKLITEITIANELMRDIKRDIEKDNSGWDSKVSKLGRIPTTDPVLKRKIFQFLWKLSKTDRSVIYAIKNLRPQDPESQKELYSELVRHMEVLEKEDLDESFMESTSNLIDTFGEIKTKNPEIQKTIAAFLKPSTKYEGHLDRGYSIDPVNRVRNAAANAIGNIQPDSMEFYFQLLDYCDDEDEEFKRSVTKALSEWNPDHLNARKAYIEKLRTGSLKCKHTLIGALESFSKKEDPLVDEVFSLLTDFANSKDDDTRILAARGVAQLDGSNPKVWELVKKGLKDSHPYVRNWSMNAIKFTPKTNPRLESEKSAILHEIVPYIDHYENQSNVIETIGHLNPQDPAIHKVLIDVLLHNHDPELQITAAQALSEIQPMTSEIYQALVQGSQSSETWVRGGHMQLRMRISEELNRILKKISP